MTLPQINQVAKPITGRENYRLCNTLALLAEVVKELEEARLIAVDTETEGLDFEDIIVGICLSTRPGTGWYLPMRHEMYDGILYEGQLTPTAVYGAIGNLLETKPCVGHNIKFDLKMLLKDGIRCNFVADTLEIAKNFFNFPSNGLKFLVKELLGHEMAALESLFSSQGSKKAIITPATLSPDEICHYAVEDANWTLQLYYYFLKQNPAIENHSLHVVETHLFSVVAEMEMFGVPSSRTFLTEQGRIAQRILERMEGEILQEIRTQLKDPEYEVKLSSGPQLAKLLFEDLKMPVLKLSKTTQKPSCDKEVLAALADQHPITKSIHVWRTMGKLNSTYLAGLVPKIHSDGRIRGNFNQLGADTGRFTSSKPNLQNLPRTQTFYLWKLTKDEIMEAVRGLIGEGILQHHPDGFHAKDKEDNWNLKLRKAPEGEGFQIWDGQKSEWTFTGELGRVDDKMYGIEDGYFKEMWRCPTRNFIEASEGYYLVEADYSQIELRILAGESGEMTLLDAYLNDKDVHTATAAAIFGISPEDVTEQQRHIGKTINFSLLYGAGAEGLSKLLKITKDEAQKLIDKYFENMTEIGSWIESTKHAARIAGSAQTALGRVRHFPYIEQGSREMRAKQEREAVNFKIQGAAADVMKMALVRTARRLRLYFGDDAKIISTVHDSVLVEVKDSIPVEHIVAVLRDGMTGFAHAFNPNWPFLKIDTKVGKAWADAKEVKLPDDLPLPPEYEGELPTVRTRQIAKEREMGLVDTQPEDIFSGLGDTYSGPVGWVIEFPKALTGDQLAALAEFLKSKQDPEAKGRVKVVAPRDGAVTVQELAPTFNLTMEDEMSLRMKVGTCTLRQELDDINPDDVLKGMDFGL